MVDTIESICIALDVFIENALAEDRAPSRFILSPNAMADLVAAQSPLFRKVRCHGHDRNLYELYRTIHPEHCPSITVGGKSGRVITADMTIGMMQMVDELGLSHYRNIPLVVQGDGYQVELESRAW